MFKHVLSALVVTSVMAGGAAFAADQTTQAPQAQTAAPASQVQTTAPAKAEKVSTSTTKSATEKKHVKVVHKQDQVKASVVKTDATVPAKTN
ncbi:hypothetical protein [Telmatospirillum siberiense]|uniref:Acid-shock protein n=1 Tax=Telmatospirillum siberiense TaxID=382514 RepID=A0A2N3PPC5_9PROT|nr:hypothetical protein [Telmatospirillum siberiense]PKU22255.1 hypothetical protein CWS72_22570 [Telmatospirillum siberiense]